jgi:hypothetical protein
MNRRAVLALVAAPVAADPLAPEVRASNVGLD